MANTPLIIDGKAAAAELLRKVAADTEEIKNRYGTVPGLAVILVGDDPASQVYVGSKVRKCGELGFYSEKIVLPETTTEQQLLTVIDSLNKNPQIHGILVQSPVPPHINEEHVILAIDPKKDVDCFHPFNTGRMFLGDTTGFVPCTPYGILFLLEHYHLQTRGKRALVIGRSNIVGKPMAALLWNRGVDATVTLAHSRTENLKQLALESDILIAAIGKPEFISGDMVKPGAVVIDVGINRIPDASKASGNRLVGDVNFAQACERASAITPVPGGVGPMTIAMLMRNTVRAFHFSISK